MKIYAEGNISAENMETMEQVLKTALSDHGIENDDVEVSLTMVSAEEIRELNRDYRDNDSVTDVLSFPQFNDVSEIPGDMPVMLGDVVICDDKVREQSVEYGHSYRRELIYLFTHSILHLLGYDHMEDDEKARMRKEEEMILERAGVSK